MAEKQRDRILGLALLMHEMHANVAKAVDSHIRLEMRQSVQLGLLGAPVEAVAPVFGQPRYGGAGGAVFPVFEDGRSIWVGGLVELCLEGLDLGVWDVDLVRNYGCIHDGVPVRFADEVSVLCQWQ